nr:hypothetical protein [Tanacetum cinerariifolium]
MAGWYGARYVQTEGPRSTTSILLGTTPVTVSSRNFARVRSNFQSNLKTSFNGRRLSSRRTSNPNSRNILHRSTTSILLGTTPIPFPPLPSILSPPSPVLSPASPPSPIRSLGYRAAMIRLRAEAASTSHYPPLPPPFILSPTRSDAPSSGTPLLLPISASTSSPPLQLPSASRREDKHKTERQLLAGRLNMLFRDRRAHAYTCHLMETEARMSREAWTTEIRELQAADRRRQTVISELLRVDHRRSTEILELRTTLQGQVIALQAQVTALQGQQGLAGGPTQPDILEEAGVTAALAARDSLRSTNGDDSHNSRTEREIGYGITDSWDEIVETLQGTPVSTDTELGRYVREFETRVRQDTDEIYMRLDDEQTERQLLAGQLNMLFRDRCAHAYIRQLMETEAMMSRVAWCERQMRVTLFMITVSFSGHFRIVQNVGSERDLLRIVSSGLSREGEAVNVFVVRKRVSELETEDAAKVEELTVLSVQNVELLGKNVELDARIDELNYDMDTELYPRMLTAMTRCGWMSRHGICLSMMKCSRSIEYRTALRKAISMAINKEGDHSEEDPTPKFYKLQPVSNQGTVLVYYGSKDSRSISHKILMSDALAASHARGEKRKNGALLSLEIGGPFVVMPFASSQETSLFLADY